jgi:hypothetical protein
MENRVVLAECRRQVQLVCLGPYPLQDLHWANKSGPQLPRAGQLQVFGTEVHPVTNCKLDGLVPPIIVCFLLLLCTLHG